MIEPIRRYVALIQRNTAGRYFVTVPDIPGLAIGGSKNIDETLAKAAEVMRDHIEMLTESGGALPAPSTLDALKGDPEYAVDFAESEMVTTLPALPARQVVKPVNITMDRTLLNAVDAEAKRRHMKRSELIAEAVQRLLVLSA